VLTLGSSLIFKATSREALASLRLDQRIWSRIGFLKEIELPPYSTGELMDILKDRARIALKPGVISDAQLAEIAATVSQRSGSDARIALLTLRRPALLAEQKGDHEGTSTQTVFGRRQTRPSWRVGDDTLNWLQHQ